MPLNVKLNNEKSPDSESPLNRADNETKAENGTKAPDVKPTSEEVTKASYDLSKFKLTRILQNNTLRKTIALLGTFPDVSDNDLAVLLLEKQAFKEQDVQTAHDNTLETVPSIFSDALQVCTEFINNIYGSFKCVPSAELNSIKTTVVYPATEKHIEKYSITQKYLIAETPALYEQLTLPYITNSQFSLDWVYNILEHRQETDRIVYEDSNPEKGYILLPDLKWDGKTLETLYLLAIVHKHNIKSLRDLNDSHLPLLYNLRDGISKAIEKRYGLCYSQLRMYFHYQPSFYHLHLHINPVRGDAPDYYQRATLPFVLFEGCKLLDEFEEKGAVRKSAEKVNNKEKLNDAVEKGCTDESVDEPQVKKIKIDKSVKDTEESPIEK
uniref:m7GpppX diphosphatase n=1 Tax=Ceratitis capitata TaxID=7213 RepID=W8B4G5_CERCA